MTELELMFVFEEYLYLYDKLSELDGSELIIGNIVNITKHIAKLKQKFRNWDPFEGNKTLH